MASTVFLKFVFLSVYLLLVIKNNQAWKSRRDLSSLINILGHQYGNNKRPLIVVVDAQANKNRQLDESSDTSNERMAVHISHLLQKSLHNKAKRLHLAQPTTKSLPQLKEYMGKKIQKLRADKGIKNKNVLRSPLVKKLLRISNTIQCEAKDDCQDNCDKKYNGKKVVNCEVECEVKYDCDEELEKGPCEEGCEESGECDDSGECSMSTRAAIPLYEEKKKAVHDVK